MQKVPVKMKVPSFLQVPFAPTETKKSPTETLRLYCLTYLNGPMESFKAGNVNIDTFN